jgi:2,3-bisphosphoglycerate-dependent phosphoglycerate mutase
MATIPAGGSGATRVWLLRHAESAVPHVFHGAESDIELSERGTRQAAALAPVLAALRPRAVISSAMRRACATAAPAAAACGLPLRVEPDLHERRVGALVGTTFHSSEGVWPDTLRRWVAGETGYAPDGAESFDDIRSRVAPVWQRLTEEFEGQGFVIVAHGVVCKVLLLSLVAGLSPADWHRLGSIHNAAIQELAREGEDWRLLRVNDVPEEVRRVDAL